MIYNYMFLLPILFLSGSLKGMFNAEDPDKRLYEALSYMTQLTSLDLSFNRFHSELRCDLLVNALLALPHLEKLNIEGCNLDDPAMLRAVAEMHGALKRIEIPYKVCVCPFNLPGW